MTDVTTRNSDRRLIIPALGGLYASLGEGAETLLRVVAGLALVTHGAGKIGDPSVRRAWSRAWASIPAPSGR